MKKETKFAQKIHNFLNSRIAIFIISGIIIAINFIIWLPQEYSRFTSYYNSWWYTILFIIVIAYATLITGVILIFLLTAIFTLADKIWFKSVSETKKEDQ